MPARTSLFKQSGEREHEESVPPRRTGSTKAHAKLVIHRGRAVGKEFPLCEDESHIGRWDADGGIFPDVDLDSDDPEAKVSRRHARITHRGEKYYVEDLGSTNGTFVNRGRRLLPGDRQPLRDGDEVIVGKTFLKFHVLKSS
ncbi:MAG: FHA domain-containing protein [Rubrivivax sp.]|nr:FHA domain-containing protein [Pyrinomonadaceae bacterium]